MSNKITEVGNAEIAIFDGWQRFEDKDDEPVRVWWSKPGITWEQETPPEFDCNWEILMPVIEKIRGKGYYFQIEFYEETTRAYVVPEQDKEGIGAHRYLKDEPAIIVIWSVVVDFIQWLNTQKEDQP